MHFKLLGKGGENCLNFTKDHNTKVAFIRTEEGKQPVHLLLRGKNRQTNSVEHGKRIETGGNAGRGLSLTVEEGAAEAESVDHGKTSHNRRRMGKKNQWSNRKKESIWEEGTRRQRPSVPRSAWSRSVCRTSGGKTSCAKKGFEPPHLEQLAPGGQETECRRSGHPAPPPGQGKISGRKLPRVSQQPLTSRVLDPPGPIKVPEQSGGKLTKNKGVEK